MLLTIWLVIISIIWGLLVIPSLMTFVTAPMLFDAPQAIQRKSNWVFAGALVSMPLVLLVSITGAWTARLLLEIDRLALGCSLLPMVNLSVGSFILLWQGRQNERRRLENERQRRERRANDDES